MKKMIIFLSIIGILLINGCNFLNTAMNGTDTVEIEKGILILSIQDSVASRTISPVFDLNPVSFLVQGIGPNSESFQIDNLTTTSSETLHLTAGDWIISVDAYNADGTAIGKGEVVSTLVAGETKTINIDLTILEGTGILTLDADFTAMTLSNPILAGNLISSDLTNTSISFSIATDNMSGSYLSNSLSAGTYSLELQLFDGTILVAEAFDTIHIIQDQTTAGTLSFVYDPLLAEITVTITVNTLPITISFTGNQLTMPFGGSMTVTAQTSVLVDSYQWYMNGEILIGQGSQSLTISDALVVGFIPIGDHRIDVVVQKNDNLSSSSFTFTVQ